MKLTFVTVLPSLYLPIPAMWNEDSSGGISRGELKIGPPNDEFGAPCESERSSLRG